jgi:hypothetical protein
MSPREYNTLISGIDFDKLFYEHTMINYFNLLLKKLKNAKI